MIPWGTLLQGGAGGLLAFVIWLIVTGRLVPRSALLDAQKERDRWAEAMEKAMEQNAELLTGARVTRQVIQALPDAAGNRQ